MKMSQTIPLLALGSLALVSCGLQVTTGPINRGGTPAAGDAETKPAEAVDAPPTTRGRRTTGTVPPPVTGNPFDVPDVAGNLPAERDLQPGTVPGAPAPIEPRDPAGADPTVRATPGGTE